MVTCHVVHVGTKCESSSAASHNMPLSGSVTLHLTLLSCVWCCVVLCGVISHMHAICHHVVTAWISMSISEVDALRHKCELVLRQHVEAFLEHLEVKQEEED